MTPITQVENIPLFEGRSVRVGELDLAIFNLGDRFAAVRCVTVLSPGRWWFVRCMAGDSI